MTVINVGLVGFGLAGSVFHAPLITSEPQLRLVSIATTRKLPSEYSTVRVVADPKALVEDPGVDLVVIASPNPSHAPLARLALVADKHVVVDKPFSLTLDEANGLIDLAQDRKRLVTVFQNRRWDGPFLTAQAALKTGNLGAVKFCEIRFDRCRTEPKVGWRESSGVGSGIVYDLAPHLIDQAICLFGYPQAVMADIAIQRKMATVADYFHLTLHYENLRVILGATMLANYQPPRLVMHGTDGSFVQFGMDQQEHQLLRGLRPGDAGWGGSEAVSATVIKAQESSAFPVSRGSYQHFYHAVADALLDGAPPPVSLDDARWVMAVLEGSLRSAVEGRKIALV